MKLISNEQREMKKKKREKMRLLSGNWRPPSLINKKKCGTRIKNVKKYRLKERQRIYPKMT